MTTDTILVESNSVHREAMKRMLVDGGYHVVACVQNVDCIDDWSSLPRTVKVVLSGAQDANRERDIAKIRSMLDEAVVVILGGRADLQSTFTALQAGAHAYLDDSTSGEAFLKSLEIAGLDRAVISLRREEMVLAEPDLQRDTLHVSRPAATSPAPAPGKDPSEDAPATPAAASLSPREAAILKLLREGAPNKLIALRLCMTESTVKVHLKAILRKIRVKNRTQAAVWAMENESKMSATSPQSQESRSSSTQSAGMSSTLLLRKSDVSVRHDH